SPDREVVDEEEEEEEEYEEYPGSPRWKGKRRAEEIVETIDTIAERGYNPLAWAQLYSKGTPSTRRQILEEDTLTENDEEDVIGPGSPLPLMTEEESAAHDRDEPDIPLVAISPISNNELLFVHGTIGPSKHPVKILIDGGSRGNFVAEEIRQA